MATGHDNATDNPPVATCPQCGAALGLLSSGETTCASCLLATALTALEPDDHAALYQGRDAPSLEQLNHAVPAYEFLELLGRGGGGWVFLATQRSLNRLVALKLLRRRAAGFEADRQRFQQEAQTLAAFNHPQLVTVHDYGSIDLDDAGDQHDYLVMEFVSGPTLRQRLARGPLSAAEATRVTRQIAAGMQYAHERGVVHRDLKPENVLFTCEGDQADLKVADFGIVKLVDGTHGRTLGPDNNLTSTGMVVGTPYYMAPEWRSVEGQVTPRGDIFSLGVMLYEMLTGQVPVGAFRSPAESRHAPRALSDAAMRALAADPADRFASAQELLEAISAPPVTVSASRDKPIVPRMIAAALVVALGGFATYAAWRPTVRESADATASLDVEAETPQPPSTEPPATETVAAPPAAAPIVPASGESSVPDVMVVPAEDVEISDVHIPSGGMFGGKLSFELTVRDADLIKRLKDQQATLHWIYTSSHQRPFHRAFEGQVPELNGRQQLVIETFPPNTHGSMWPATIHVEERWAGEEGQPPGKRRVSRPFRVEAWHSHNFGPY